MPHDPETGLLIISTHDLTRRSTKSNASTILNGVNFNSRSHKEVDFHARRCVLCRICISTHDLTKRSTSLYIFSRPFSTAFQLTTSRRGRRGIAPMWKAHDSVSTHDLTKRSTHHLSNTDPIDRVSTHDLSKRSTVGTIGRKTAVAFQLTTSRRGRRFIIFV